MHFGIIFGGEGMIASPRHFGMVFGREEKKKMEMCRSEMNKDDFLL